VTERLALVQPEALRRLITVALPPSIKDSAELAPVRDGRARFRAAIRQAVAGHSPMGGRRA
jgi:hypothetical protein